MYLRWYTYQCGVSMRRFWGTKTHRHGNRWGGGIYTYIHNIDRKFFGNKNLSLHGGRGGTGVTLDLRAQHTSTHAPLTCVVADLLPALPSRLSLDKIGKLFLCVCNCYILRSLRNVFVFNSQLVERGDVCVCVCAERGAPSRLGVYG